MHEKLLQGKVTQKYRKIVCFATTKSTKIHQSKLFKSEGQGFEFPQTIRPRVVALNDNTVCGTK